MVICNSIECTGCAACKDICPKQCISMVTDNLDALHPKINQKECINCGLCHKTCPNNNIFQFYEPQNVYAAWSTDKSIRETSASGGIAFELYRYWLQQGGLAVGVIYERDKGCHYILIENENDLHGIQNSKYTFSDTSGIYKEIKQRLQIGLSILFIGVPCQVAGLYGYLGKDYPNLTTVDIICHGMPPAAYLEQHLTSIEKKKKLKTLQLFFRDPKYYTYTYTFTLYSDNSNAPFYKKRVLNTDNYQLGYHRALIYRENCYNCRYARKERIADLTIGDFSGLGKLAPFKNERNNVSCILQNTLKGQILLNNLGSAIYKEIRPKNEAFDFERQLSSPSIKHEQRSIFEIEYIKTQDFIRASNKALKKEKIKAFKLRIYHNLKKTIKKLLPLSIWSHIKTHIKKQ